MIIKRNSLLCFVKCKVLKQVRTLEIYCCPDLLSLYEKTTHRTSNTVKPRGKTYCFQPPRFTFWGLWC